MRRTMARRRFIATFLGGLAILAGMRDGRSVPGRKTVRLEKWRCTNQNCDPYIYDPSLGDININDEDNPIPPGVAFEDLPGDWICHVCGDRKSHFVPTGEWVEVTVPV